MIRVPVVRGELPLSLEIKDVLTVPKEQLENFDSLFEFIDGHNGFIAGGVFKDVCYGSKVKDVDLFFRNEADFSEAVEYFSKNGGKKIYVSGNSVGFEYKRVTLDLVCKFFGSPEEILNKFDFTVTQCALVRNGGSYELVQSEQFAEDLKEKRIKYAGAISGFDNTLHRVVRYRNLGFVADDETIVEVLAQFLKNNVEVCHYRVEDVLERYSKWRSNEYYREGDGFRWSDFPVDLPIINYTVGSKSSDLSSAYFNRKISSFGSNFQMRISFIRGIEYLMNYEDDLAEKFDKLYEELVHHFCPTDKDIVVHELDFAFKMDVEFKYKNNYCEAGYSVQGMRLMRFLDARKELIPKDHLKALVNLSTCCFFVISEYYKKLRFLSGSDGGVSTADVSWKANHDVGSNEYPLCRIHYLGGADLFSYENNYLDSVDVIWRALTLEDSDEWFIKCADFFHDFFNGGMSQLPTLEEWFEAFDMGFFDPEIPPALLVPSLISRDFLEEEVFKENKASMPF